MENKVSPDLVLAIGINAKILNVEMKFIAKILLILVMSRFAQLTRVNRHCSLFRYR